MAHGPAASASLWSLLGMQSWVPCQTYWIGISEAQPRNLFDHCPGMCTDHLGGPIMNKWLVMHCIVIDTQEGNLSFIELHYQIWTFISLVSQSCDYVFHFLLLPCVRGSPLSLLPSANMIICHSKYTQYYFSLIKYYSCINTTLTGSHPSIWNRADINITSQHLQKDLFWQSFESHFIHFSLDSWAEWEI